jgi:hypothetical protein
MQTTLPTRFMFGGQRSLRAFVTAGLRSGFAMLPLSTFALVTASFATLGLVTAPFLSCAVPTLFAATAQAVPPSRMKRQSVETRWDR